MTEEKASQLQNLKAKIVSEDKFTTKHLVELVDILPEDNELEDIRAFLLDYLITDSGRKVVNGSPYKNRSVEELVDELIFPQIMSIRDKDEKRVIG